MTMPVSMMSDASSGGVFSNTERTVVAIVASGSEIASVISCEVISMVLGKPAT